MRSFEVGKSYKSNGDFIITITERSKSFISYTGANGAIKGRKKVGTGLFAMGEYILIEANGLKYFCFASKEIEGAE